MGCASESMSCTKCEPVMIKIGTGLEEAERKRDMEQHAVARTPVALARRDGEAHPSVTITLLQVVDACRLADRMEGPFISALPLSS
ncbi:hypothetical protein TcBrA4_0102440 [Trypanosoma cruzi]|nr:hypothetical protein TcBrA4_0102440 [Trypanosoma cruzi]